MRGVLFMSTANGAMPEQIFVGEPVAQTFIPPAPSEEITVADVAALLNLSPVKSSGKIEYHGANPEGGELNAGDDGFMLFQEGNALDRKSQKKYTSVEVAKLAGINPDHFEPYKNYKAKNGTSPTSSFGLNNSSIGSALNGAKSSHSVVIKSDAKKPKEVDTRTLEERGISKATMDHFGIRAGKESWAYPTFTISGKSMRYREKMFDPEQAGLKYGKNKKPIKYRWLPGDSAAIPKCYNHPAMKEAKDKDLWIVNGEVSVWSLHQIGVKAISPMGEARMIEAIIEDCKAAHVGRIHIAFDNDPTGHRATVRAVERAESIGLAYHAYELMGKEGCDISDYYEFAGFDKEAFIESLKGISRVSPAKLAEWSDNAPSTEEAKKEEVQRDSSDAKAAKSEQLGRMLMDAGARPFYTEEDAFYITIPQNGINMVYPMEDSLLGHRLYYFYYNKTGKMIDNSALDNAMRTLKGYALNERFKEEVWIRSAWHEGHIYIDLARDDNTVVKIGADCDNGWELTNDPPVYFRRPKGFWELPLPIRGGDINKLRPLINAGHDEDWMLMVAWMVNAMFPPSASFPVLAINGEQGSAKSTTCRILKKIIDPNFTPLIGSSVREERDLAITARNSYVIGFDNLSGLSKWQSDALCQLATGQGFRTRKLHTDDEEILFNAKRPMIVNGIEPLLGREDFQNRCLACNLPPISDSNRIDENEINTKVEELQPGILGWIFDVIAHSLANIDNVKLEKTPRMADFVKRIVAGEELMPWENGKFMEVLMDNRDELVELALENSPLGSEIVRLMEAKSFYESTPTELREILNRRALAENRNSDSWPTSTKWFSTALTRISPNLRKAGIDYKSGRSGGKRYIKLRRMAEDEV
jgi:hypothetical protein